MSKISKDGEEQLKIVRNALDSIYKKIDSKNFDSVREEFSAMGKILASVKNWEKV
jgi:hypothetical protein